MITSRSRYALKIMMDLAMHADQQRRHDIATRHGIPADYMDHILASLREGGLVTSIRGRHGGLKIGKDPEEITVWEIFSAAEANMEPVACLHDSHACEVIESCITKNAWGKIYGAIKDSLAEFKLAHLVADHSLAAGLSGMIPIAPGLVECKGPRRLS